MKKTTKDNVTIRMVTGSNSRPQLYVTKELRDIGLSKGDYVAVITDKRNKRLIIQPVKVVVQP